MLDLNYGGGASAAQRLDECTQFMEAFVKSMQPVPTGENGLCNNKNNINEAEVWGSLWLSILAVIIYFRGHLK